MRLVDPDGQKEIEFTIRHFIQQHYVLTPFGNVKGDNRGFSLDSGASKRTELTLKIETDPRRSASGLLSQAADTGVSHNYTLSADAKADPKAWNNEISATPSRDSNGNVIIKVKTYVSEPFPNSFLGPLTPPIYSEATIVVSADGNTIGVTGIRTATPSMEINATVDGATFPVYRGSETALFAAGIFFFTPFSADCAGNSCDQNELPMQDAPP
jgi:hypothetical protein